MHQPRCPAGSSPRSSRSLIVGWFYGALFEDLVFLVVMSSECTAFTLLYLGTLEFKDPLFYHL